ncbi:MAG TPA: hypothetical protein PK867_21705 [Pirellulales bacterium]|nr:hypothetical protein [Pirellulales bacterium]
MNVEAIHALLHVKPFVPFEVHLSSGEIHEVRHPENAVVLKSNLFTGFPEKDTFASCALSHVTEVQPLERA